MVSLYELRAFADAALEPEKGAALADSNARKLLAAMDLDHDGVATVHEWLAFWDQSLQLNEKMLLRMEASTNIAKLRLLRLFNAVDKEHAKSVKNHDLIAACKHGFSHDVSSQKTLAQMTRLLELYPIVSQERWIWAWDRMALKEAELDDLVGTLCAAHNVK